MAVFYRIPTSLTLTHLIKIFNPVSNSKKSMALPWKQWLTTVSGTSAILLVREDNQLSAALSFSILLFALNFFFSLLKSKTRCSTLLNRKVNMKNSMPKVLSNRANNSFSLDSIGTYLECCFNLYWSGTRSQGLFSGRGSGEEAGGRTWGCSNGMVATEEELLGVGTACSNLITSLSSVSALTVCMGWHM